MVERGGVLVLVELDVELQTAHAREVILARIEEHAFEERSRGVERRRIARAQLAVDFDQRFFRLVHRVALQRVGDDVAHVVALGEEELEARRAARHHLVQAIGGQLHVGFDNHFAGVQIDNVGSRDRAIQFGGFNLDLVDVRCANRLQRARRNLAAGVRNLFALVQDGVRGLRSQQVRRRLGSAATAQCTLPSATWKRSMV